MRQTEKEAIQNQAVTSVETGPQPRLKWKLSPQWLLLFAVIAVLAAGIAVAVGVAASLLITNAGKVSAVVKIAVTASAAIHPPPLALANERAWGPTDAPIKIVAWIDYQCPACGAYYRNDEAAVIRAFAESGKVHYEVRSVPFIGRESIDAAQAAWCAMDQDKFWQMHHVIFSNQAGENQGAYSKVRLEAMATNSGLDSSAFNRCLDSDKYLTQVYKEHDEAFKLGINQTPSFVVNGKIYTGALGVADFTKIFSEIAPGVMP